MTPYRIGKDHDSMIAIHDREIPITVKRLRVGEFDQFKRELNQMHDIGQKDELDPRPDAWVRAQARRCIRIAEGVLEVERERVDEAGEPVLGVDGQPVVDIVSLRTGEDLYDEFGSIAGFSAELLQQITHCNALTPAARKNWQSRPASESGSRSELPTADAGAAPAPTAANASGSSTAASADATASLAEMSSGTTVQ